MAGFFLIVHIVLFFIFKKYDVLPMVYVNLFSMVFYCAMFCLIHRGHLHAFVIATYLEICIHMGLAEYFTGWNSGFQITLIGICVLLFYAEYIARSLHISYTTSLFIAPAAITAYLAPLIINILRPALYPLPAGVESFLQIAWAVILFTIALPILQYFVLIAARSQEQLTNEVLHDKLTGLPNRYYMSDFFKRMESSVQYWIAIMDIDDFKNVNDTYGHNCGDYVLITVAGLIRDLSPEVTACRWGGEEFLLAGKHSSADPTQVLEKLRSLVESYPFQYEGTPLHLTVTIGAAWFIPTCSIDEWIDEANKKLYDGKKNGKNCVLI